MKYIGNSLLHDRQPREERYKDWKLPLVLPGSEHQVGRLLNGAPEQTFHHQQAVECLGGLPGELSRLVHCLVELKIASAEVDNGVAQVRMTLRK